MSKHSFTIYKCDACGKEVDRFAWLIIVRADSRSESTHELCASCADAVHGILYPKAEYCIPEVSQPNG